MLDYMDDILVLQAQGKILVLPCLYPVSIGVGNTILYSGDLKQTSLCMQ